MTSSHNASDNHHFVSPVSAGTYRPHDGFETGADAPEVVDTHSPSTVVASPVFTNSATNSPEVVKQYVYNDDNAKEVTTLDASDKMSVPAEQQNTQYPQATADLQGSNGEAEKAATTGKVPPEKEQKKILGLKRKMFFIILAVICIVIVVAIGAGVGAGVSKKSNSGGADEANTTNTASSSSGSETPTPTESASPTSETPSGTTASQSSATSSGSSVPTPKFLNETDFEEGFGFQGFSKENFTGLYTDVLLKEINQEVVGEYDFDIHSYLWVPKITSCCISMCTNTTEDGLAGWKCQPFNQTDASQAFSTVAIWCDGKDRTDERATQECVNAG